MILFLDTSTLLATAGSADGASRFVILNGEKCGWRLVSSGYCLQEANRNLRKLHPESLHAWSAIIMPRLHQVTDVVTVPAPLVLPAAKDRPVVASALAAKAEALLTLDRADFQGALGSQIYGMAIQTPAAFLIEQRRTGRI